jgi:hypothetical protein
MQGMDLPVSSFSYQIFLPCNGGGAERADHRSADAEDLLLGTSGRFLMSSLVRWTGDIIA